MHKKRFRLKILALTILVTSLLVGCNLPPTLTTTNIEDSSAKDLDSTPSRFSAEKTNISGTSHFDYCYIITDNQTGKQFLYTYCLHDRGSGATICELGTTSIE